MYQEEYLQGLTIEYIKHVTKYFWDKLAHITVGELRSLENARCTIMMPFVYEYATVYLLHATPYVRMLRRIYDPKRVSRINYAIFPRYLEENSSFASYLGKLIIHIVLLQLPNTMYLPGIEVSDDIVSLCGDGPA